jgi:hypothetical protein
VCVTEHATFVIAEGDLCVMCAVIRDAEVAFGDDKKYAQRDKHNNKKRTNNNERMSEAGTIRNPQSPIRN